MSISKKIRSFLYSLKDLKKSDSLAIQKIRKDSPVVSLTTVPSRINNISPTLYSLLNQEVVPKKIVLNLGADLFNGIPLPKFLSGLEMVHVNFVEKDMGPATKFLNVIKTEPQDQTIVVVDDDMYYSKNLLTSLVAAANEDKKSVFCVNGCRFNKNMVAADQESNKAIRNDKKRVALILGAGGYILRPSFFTDDLLFNFEIGAPVRARFDDDFWISGHLSRLGIHKYQIPIKGKRLSLVNTITSAIGGDRALLQQEMIEYFSQHWAEDEKF